jgi:restriction system protein
MKTYYRLMLGAKSIYAEECFKGNFIGVHFDIHQDLTGRFYDTWREFNKEFIPVYLAANPGKAKVTAGLACATIWVISKYLKTGDIVLCPNGSGSYLVGEISGDYSYHHGQILPHRRTVNWLPQRIERTAMSDSLRNSTGAIATYCDITKYAAEIEQLIGRQTVTTLVSNDPTIEDATEFALEKHLEDFLVKNWKQTELGKLYDIYTDEDGQIIGQQYQTDTGPIDLLAISKDKKTLLVVELKKGRASDSVVGQVQRYMGYVQEELAEKNQTVRGVIIALEDDLRIKRALSVAPNIEFYRYQVNFKLFKS